MVLKHCVTTSAILAGMSVVLQAIAFVIPGWLLIETVKTSFNMALWYVIMCQRSVNATKISCETIIYKELFDKRSQETVSHLHLSYSTVVSTQWQVTACLLLTISAFILTLYQLKTFHSQIPDQPGIYDNVPPNTCNLRSKFIYSGGFAGIFQIIAGPLLFTDIYQMAKVFYKLEKRQPEVPFALFILGLGGVSAAFSGIIELFIAFKTKENPRRQHSEDSGNAESKLPHQTRVPLVAIKGQGQTSRDSPVRNSSPVECCEYNGDFNDDSYGQYYNVHNPAFHTQGCHKHSVSQELFPGYKLGRQNLQGHDKKWWRKVTFASIGVR